MMTDKIARKFAPASVSLKIEPLGEGNINDTYLVRQDNLASFVLQRLNTRVFPEPALLMANLRLLQNHLKKKEVSSLNIIPEIITDRSGNDFFLDEEGGAWRALSFIENSTTLKNIPDPFQAREAGRLLAVFHRLTGDLPTETMNDPLPELHDTPRYFRKYEKTGNVSDLKEKSEELRHVDDFIISRRSTGKILAEAEEKGVLKRKVIHGDPKLDNILFDRKSGRALTLIDLDTVKPGLLLHDLADFLRSCCNKGGEDPACLDDITFDLDLFKAALAGYSEEGKGVLQKNDVLYLYEAIRLIPFELGLRFVTDYLEGNVYFKTTDRNQNLRRALAQFRLTENIEMKEEEIRSIIKTAT